MGARVGGVFGLEGQGGCERRIEVFVRIQKKNWVGRVGGRVWGVRVDVKEELKFLRNSQKMGGGGGGVGGQGGCERRIEVFVKIRRVGEMSGRGSGWGGGQGGCERRVEVFEKIHKKIGGRGSGWM